MAVDVASLPRHFTMEAPLRVQLDDEHDRQVRFLSPEQFEELFGMAWEPGLDTPEARAAGTGAQEARRPRIDRERKKKARQKAAARATSARPAAGALGPSVTGPGSGIAPAPAAPRPVAALRSPGLPPSLWPAEWRLSPDPVPDPWADPLRERRAQDLRTLLSLGEPSLVNGKVVVRCPRKEAARAFGSKAALSDAIAGLRAAGLSRVHEALGEVSELVLPDVLLGEASQGAVAAYAKDHRNGSAGPGRAVEAVPVQGLAFPLDRDRRGWPAPVRPAAWASVLASCEAGLTEDERAVMDHLLNDAPVRVWEGRPCSAATAGGPGGLDGLLAMSSADAAAALKALGERGLLGERGTARARRLIPLFPGTRPSAGELAALTGWVETGALPGEADDGLPGWVPGAWADRAGIGRSGRGTPEALAARRLLLRCRPVVLEGRCAVEPLDDEGAAAAEELCEHGLAEPLTDRGAWALFPGVRLRKRDVRAMEKAMGAAEAKAAEAASEVAAAAGVLVEGDAVQDVGDGPVSDKPEPCETRAEVGVATVGPGAAGGPEAPAAVHGDESSAPAVEAPAVARGGAPQAPGAASVAALCHADAPTLEELAARAREAADAVLARLPEAARIADARTLLGRALAGEPAALGALCAEVSNRDRYWVFVGRGEEILSADALRTRATFEVDWARLAAAAAGNLARAELTYDTPRPGKAEP